MTDAKKQALEKTITQIRKQFGEESLYLLGGSDRRNVDTMSTGVLNLDIALGSMGYPKGRIIEVYGPESSGKTTVALHAIAEVQSHGGQAAFLDVEHALDPQYAKALGVDIDELLLSQPDNAEQTLEIAEALVRSGAVDLLVVDSVAALVSKKEIEGEMGDAHVGVQARLMSQALRKLTGITQKNNVTIIFINQIREKIGVMFGNPETQPGGRALKFYSTIRLDVRRGEAIKQGTDVVGHKTKIKVVKNKIAPPFKVAEVDMMFGEGISKYASLVDLAVEHEIMVKSGAWYSYENERVGQGRENAKQYMKENPELYEEIHQKILEKLGA